MKKLIVFLTLIPGLIFTYGQSVSINNDGSLPHSSAQLDIKSASKGILIPRTSTSSRLSISSAAKGLMLYDTTTNSFWFHNGNGWIEIGNRNTVWSVNGNNGIDSPMPFIGTTDGTPLIFRMNNVRSGLIDSIHYTTSFGYKTLPQNRADNRGNSAFGAYALSSNVWGEFNTAIGSYTLQSDTDGRRNTAIGAEALVNNHASDNTALGSSAMYSNTRGTENTAVGGGSLGENLEGSYNVAVGNNALSYNKIGVQNTAVGYMASRWNEGLNNVAVGFKSMYNTSGSENVGIGVAALYNNTTGGQNIAIGINSGVDQMTPSLWNTISIGNSGWLNGYYNQVFIGNPYSTWIGGWQSWTKYSDERIKKNISEDVIGLEFIKQLKPVTYNLDTKVARDLTHNAETTDYPNKYDIEKIRYTGFLAQDVEKAANATGYDFSGLHKPKSDRDLYSLSYADFVVPLTKAVQEQQVIIEDLKKQIEQLQKAVADLQKK